MFVEEYSIDYLLKIKIFLCVVVLFLTNRGLICACHAPLPAEAYIVSTVLLKT